MEKKVLHYIHENDLITAGDHVLIGVSGGADSLALLHFLDHYKKALKINVAVAHLNHCLRGEAANRDEEVVRDFCEMYKIPFFSVRIDVGEIASDHKISVEEAGRQARYAFFEKVCQEESYNRIALGHHLDDQAETILMRLIRGTGIKGISGIRSNRTVIRPFLSVSRQEILDYCRVKGLTYCTDQSNFSNVYTRNKIRLELMPMILSINPQAQTHFCEFAQIANDYEDFLEDYLSRIEDTIIKKEQDRVLIKRKLWLEEKKIVRQALLRRAIALFKGSLKEIEYNHIIAFERLIKGDKTTGEVHFPLGVRGVRRYQSISIEMAAQKEEKTLYPKTIRPDKTYILSSYHLIIESEILPEMQWKEKKKDFLIKDLKNHTEKVFDYDKINAPLFIRIRETGDFFYPVGMKEKKSLKKYFIDKKIIRQKRDQIPLLAMGNEIVWVVGYAVNGRLLADERTKNAIRIKITLC
ncbi:tRNA lysidine(34) synthetase TilS [Eubacteriaceae bacterium ES2]|nr:tRNA lysidine(34) synthetase TilS [Eubacteriaceae bacterium ES2]